jgi:hypothetical protein
MSKILGTHTLGTAMLYEVDTNPTTGGGISAGVGDFAIAKDGSGFFYKTGATNTDWEKGTTSGDLGGYNVLLVRKNPSVGEYATINDAISAIGVSSSSNRYVIQVGVGTFTESYIDLSSKPYVSIVGTSIESTIIEPNASNHDIINIGEGNELSFFTLQNAGVGYWGITMIDTGNYGQAHKISFDDCDGNIYIKSITQDTFFYGEYIDFNGLYTTGLKVESTNGFRCFANMENYYNYPDVTATIVGTYVTGTNADCHVLTSGHTTDSNGNIESGLGTAFYAENGSNIQIAATDIQGFNKGIWIANVGSAPNISAVAVLSLLNATYDIQIEHPSATGTIGGTFNNSKIVIASGATIGLLAQDATNGSLLITNKLDFLYKNGTVTDVSTLIAEGSTMGVEEGGILSDGGGFVVDISLGYGYFEQFPDNDVIQRIDWSNTSITLSANVDKYIYFNNNGLLVSNGAEPDTRYNILLGRVVTNGTGIEFIDASPSDAEHTSNLISNNLKNAIGSVYASGSIVSQNVTPLHLDVTGGEYYFGENRFTPQGGINITFTEVYGSGSGVITGQNTVNNTQYDNAGVLTSLTSGYYAKGSIYLVGQGVNQKFYFVFAQSQYSTLLAAQQANIPTPPTSFKGSVVLIAGIIVQQGNTNIVQIIDERPVVGFRASGVNASADHLSLLNLNAGTDGDGGHTNMFVVSGAKAMTGNLDMGSNNVINAGTFNSVVIQAHASRHLPNGADPLTTAAPTTNLSGSTTNSVGIQNSISRSDHCFSADTELLTENGYISYKDIQVGVTKAATLNLETGKIEYQVIKNKFVYDNFDKLVSFKSSRGEILVTDGHNIIDENPFKDNHGKRGKKYTKYRKYKASEAFNKSIVRIPTVPSCVDTECEFKEEEDFFTLLGIIISEGHFIGNSAQRGNGIRIYQNTIQSNFIRNILNKLKVPFTEQKRTLHKNHVNDNPKEHIVFYLPAEYVKKYIYPFITEKRISIKLMALRGSKFKSFLNGLIFGDGFIHRNRNEKLKELSKVEILNKYDILTEEKLRVCYSTGDELLKDQFCHLLLLNGYSTKSTFRNVGVGNGSWTINIIKNNDNLYFTGKVYNGRKKNITYVPYKGDVWCVSVPNGSLVVRRNGLQFICGNSHAITGAALTKTNDTNVTLSLGGSFNTALLNAASLTLGWNGQLSVARGGTGVDGSAYTDAGLLYYDLSSTSFKNSSLFSYAFTNDPNYAINGSNANPIKGQTTINNTITINSWDGGIYSNSISNIFFNDGTGARDLVLEYQDNIGASGTITIVDSLANGLFQYTPDSGMFVSVKAPNSATLTLTNTDDGAQLNFTTRTVAPTTPNSGDMWVDLTGLKFRKSATTIDLSGTVIATRGGTGQTVYAVGDILFANTTTSLSKLSDVATGNALISGGVGVAPSYGKIGLTTHVSGTLGATNGGTSFNTYATGDIIYASAANVLSKLAIGSTGQVLTVVGGIPTWSSGGNGTVTSVSVVTANGISGTVATATTTPAITLTLGAITPTSVNGNTFTLGTGTLTLSTFTLTVGGTSSINGIFSGTSSGTNTGDQTITLTGEATGSGTGSFGVTLTNSAVIGKVLTGYVSGSGVISPTDSILSAIQKLNGNISALITGVSSVSGTTNRISVSPTSGAVIVDISATYIGQSSITTLGTITTGVWNGTTIAIANGGTGQTTALSAFNALSPLTTKGDLIVYDATNNSRLGVGIDGTVLTADSTQTLGVKWSAPTAITTYPYTAKTTTYVITSTDFSIDCTSGTFTVTLPTAVGITGKVYVITNSGTGIITLAANGAETITGSNTLTLKVQYQSLTVQSNGAGWIII